MAELMLTTADVAVMLALSPKTISEWCLHKKIPHYRFGDRYRFRKIEVEQWVESLHTEARK